MSGRLTFFLKEGSQDFVAFEGVEQHHLEAIFDGLGRGYNPVMDNSDERKAWIAASNVSHVEYVETKNDQR